MRPHRDHAWQRAIGTPNRACAAARLFVRKQLAAIPFPGRIPVGAVGAEERALEVLDGLHKRVIAQQEDVARIVGLPLRGPPIRIERIEVHAQLTRILTVRDSTGRSLSEVL